MEANIGMLPWAISVINSILYAVFYGTLYTPPPSCEFNMLPYNTLTMCCECFHPFEAFIVNGNWYHVPSSHALLADTAFCKVAALCRLTQNECIQQVLMVTPSQVDSEFIVPACMFFLNRANFHKSLFLTQFMFEQLLRQKSWCEGQMEWWYIP